MTAETDIAAIDDGGVNTALEVRTALTSVLNRPVQSKEQSLTNEAPSGTGAYEQWGTEELEFAGLSGYEVTVDARVDGYISVLNVDDATFDTKLQISFNNGSAWTDCTSTTFTTNVGAKRIRGAVNSAGIKSGSATNTIQVRAMVQASSLTNSPTWANGIITARCQITAVT